MIISLAMLKRCLKETNPKMRKNYNINLFCTNQKNRLNLQFPNVHNICKFCANFQSVKGTCAIK